MPEEKFPWARHRRRFHRIDDSSDAVVESRWLMIAVGLYPLLHAPGELDDTLPQYSGRVAYIARGRRLRALSSDAA